MIATENLVFEYGQPDGSSMVKGNVIAEVPEKFKYYQSIEQSFYFIEDVSLENTDIEIGDWIVAYNDDVIVGARMWNGSYTDIPAMGNDGTYETVGYMEAGDDNPTFKLYKTSSKEVIDLVSSNIPKWGTNQAHIITLSGLEFPKTVSLENAYPNPFNPSTKIRYHVPEGGIFTNLSIYDVRGRLVTELVNDYQIGSHDSYQVIWNAEMQSSGVYFIRLVAGDAVQTS
jgi:hypothetical protein